MAEQAMPVKTAALPEAADRGDSRILFECGGIRYLLPAEEVEQLLPCAACRLYPLPVPDSRIEGLLNIGGRITAVLRFSRFSYAEAVQTAGAYIVVTDGQERFAFRADTLHGIRSSRVQEEAVLLSAADLLGKETE